MADLSAVETALVDQIAAVLFPTVDYQQGSDVASVPTGMTLKVFRGWPIAASLDASILAGRAQVSVFPDNMSRNTSRYTPQFLTREGGTPTLTATAVGSVVTFGGTGGAGQVAGVAVGNGVSTVAYAVRLGAGDTPTTVATAFAALIDGASSVGPALTVPGVADADVVADATSISVTRTQEQVMRISCWCPSPATRDALASVLDGGLADLRRFALSDGSYARMSYRSTYVFDPVQKERIWRRDLSYLVEYNTTRVETQTPMLFGTLGVGISVAAGDGIPTVGDVLLQFGPAGPPPTEVYVDEDTGDVLLDAGGSLLAPVPE